MNLRDYLKREKMTRERFAKKVGVSRVTLQRYIFKRTVPSLSIQLAIEYLTSGDVSRDDWNASQV